MKDDKSKKMRVLLRFTNKKLVTMTINENMSLKSFRNLILFAFKEDLKNSKFKLYHGAKLLEDDNISMAQFNKDELNGIIVSLTQNERKESFNKEWNEQYDQMELYVYSNYRDVIKIGNNSQAERDMIGKLPLMHDTLKQRIELLNEKNRLDFLNLDPDNIENFSLRDYFKIEIIFKLFLFYILFGSHIKGYNIPLLISMLIIYYWYCLYSDLSAHYDKKIKELDLTPEELREIKFLETECENEVSESENQENSENKNQDQNKFNATNQNLFEANQQRLINENENNIKVISEDDDIKVEVKYS